jgi:hypothetical protein
MMLEREILSEQRVRMLRSWGHSGFHVDSSRRLLAEECQGIEQVFIYMERAPVPLQASGPGRASLRGESALSTFGERGEAEAARERAPARKGAR